MVLKVTANQLKVNLLEPVAFFGHTKMQKDTKRHEKTRKDTRKDAKRHEKTPQET